LTASWKSLERKKKEKGKKENGWIIINNYNTVKLRMIKENIHPNNFYVNKETCDCICFCTNFIVWFVIILCNLSHVSTVKQPSSGRSNLQNNLNYFSVTWIGIRWLKSKSYKTYIHTHIHTYIGTYIHTYIRTYIYTYIHTYIPTYIRTFIPTFIHTHI
jgi:hypothetical protein